MGKPIQDTPTHPDRIRGHASKMRELHQQIADERKQRDTTIVEAIDGHGMLPAAAAHYSGLSQTQIIRILADASSED